MADQTFTFHDDLMQKAKATLLKIEQQHQTNIISRSSMMKMQNKMKETKRVKWISGEQNGKSQRKMLLHAKKKLNNKNNLVFVGIHSR